MAWRPGPAPLAGDGRDRQRLGFPGNLRGNAAFPGLAANDRRYALIVAVDRYDDASLPSSPGPSRDAEELHGALMTHAGFPPANIRRVDGSGPDAMVPTRSNVLRAFHELLAAIPDDGNAMLLVAFTGHGSSADGKAYLLPRDAITRGGRVAAGEHVDRLRRRHQAAPAWPGGSKQLVLLVDSTLGGSTSSAAARRAERRLRPGGDGRGAAAPGSRGRRPCHLGRVALVRRSRRAAVALHPRLRGGRARRGRPGPRRMDHARVAARATSRQIVPERARRIDASFRQEPTVAVDGFFPNEIRFARVAARTASSSGDLRCALRAPGVVGAATCTSSTSRPRPGRAPRPRSRPSTS